MLVSIIFKFYILPIENNFISNKEFIKKYKNPFEGNSKYKAIIELKKYFCKRYL